MPLNAFEARNWTLKESLVGLTELSVDELRSLHLAAPPSSISHWDFAAQRIDYSEIEHALPDADALPFAKQFVTATPTPGWKRLSDGSV